MRKLLSILLLTLFGMPLAAPLLALGQTAESRLPACCRRAGDHHCAGNMAQQMDTEQPSPNPRFAPLTPHCPYTPGSLPTGHLTPGTPATLAGALASPPAHSFAMPPLQVTRRMTGDPSRPKRGPPVPPLT